MEFHTCFAPSQLQSKECTFIALNTSNRQPSYAKEPFFTARILTHQLPTFTGMVFLRLATLLSSLQVSCDYGLHLLRSAAWSGCDLLGTSTASPLAMAQTPTQHRHPTFPHPNSPTHNNKPGTTMNIKDGELLFINFNQDFRHVRSNNFSRLIPRTMGAGKQ